MERKIGEIFTLPDGRTLRVDAEIFGCKGCVFDPPDHFCEDSYQKTGRGPCSPMGRVDHCGVIFTDITNEKPVSEQTLKISALGYVTDPKMAEAFEAEIIEAARDAFVFRFWDYPNTRLAEIMNISEATVRRIRKKRLQKNRTQD